MAVTRDSLVVDVSINAKQASGDVDKFNSKLRETADGAGKNSEAMKQWASVFGDLSKALKNSNAETMSYMQSAIAAQVKAQQSTAQTAKVVQETAAKQGSIVELSKSAIAQLYKTLDQTSQVISDNQTMIAGALLGGIVLMKDNVVDLVKKFAGGMDAVKSTVSSVAFGFNAIGNVVKKTLPGSFFVITDLIGLLTPGLIMLGSKLQESNSAIVRTTGTILKFSGILLGGFAAAVGYAINKIGDLSIAFGTTMLEEMRKSSDEFEKYQFNMRQFSSTINGFSAQFGDKAVGSFEKWKDVLEEVNMTTTFSRDSIAGSIKLITRETAHLGLGFKNAIKILRVSADLAAVSGADITDTTQRVISAISGESSSLTQLGFDLRTSVLAKSAFVKSTGLSVEQLDEEQATMARLKVLYEQTIPLIGAAAAQTDTITGAQILYKKTVDDVNITLGQHAVLTRYFTAQTIKAYTWFANMPKPILHVIGVLKDFFSIFFIGFGTVIKFSLGITALVVAFKVLRGVALTYLGIQMSLSAAMISFLTVIGPIVAGIMFVDYAIRKMTASSGGMAYIFKNISDKFSNTAQASDSVSSQFGIQEKQVSFLASAMEKLMDVLAAVSSTIVNGLGMAILTVSSLMVQFRQVFTSSEEDWLSYQLMLEDIENQINSLSDEIKQSWEDVFPPQSLSAKQLVTSVNQVNDAVKNFRETATKAAKEINKDFSEVSEVQKAIASDFERAAMKVAETKQKLDKVFEVKLSPKDTAEKLAAAEKEAAMARVDVEKLHFDTIKKLEDERASSRIKELRDQGRVIEAIKEETKQRLDQIYKTEQGLKKVGGVRLEEQMLINQSIRSIKSSQNSEIQAARLDSLKKLRDLEDSVNKIKLEGAKSDQNVVASITARASQRKEELDQIYKIGAAQADQKSTADALLKIGYESIDLHKNQEIERKRLDLLKSVKEETRAIYNSYGEMGFVELDYIKQQNRESKISIDNKIKEIELQGLLNSEIAQQFAAQKEIVDQISKKQISNLIQSKTIFGDYLRDFKEYFALMSDLSGVSLSQVFDGLSNSLTNAIKLTKDLYNTATGGPDPKKFVGPPAPEKKGVIAGYIQDGSDIVSGMWSDMTAKASQLIPESVSGIASGLGQAAAGMGNVYMMIAKMIIDAPQMILGQIDNITGAIRSLLNFPTELLASLGRLDSILSSFISDFPDAAEKLVQKLPNILRSIVDKIPDFIITLVEELPRITEALAEVLPELVGKLVSRSPAIFAAVNKSIAYASWKMIVGLFNGIGNMIKGIKAPEMKIGIDSEHFAKSIAKITEDTNRFFNVAALGQAASNAMGQINAINDASRKIGKNIWDYFVKAMLDGAKWLGDAGTKIWNGLKTAAAYIGEFGAAMWRGLVTAVGDVAKTFGEWGTKIWEGLTGAIGKLADTFGKWGTEIWSGLTGAIGKLTDTFGAWGKEIWNGFLTPIGDAFTKFGKSIYDGFLEVLPGIGKAVEALFNGLGNSFKALFKFDMAGVVKSITEAFEAGGKILEGAFKLVMNPMIDVINGIIDAINQIKIPAITYGGSILGRDFGGTLIGETDLIPGNLASVAKFASGGLVGGVGGGDTIPALLTPGEFVMNRSAVSGIGLSNLIAMNVGKAPGGMTTQNIAVTLNIESKDRIDENFVRQRIMPAIREELKRGSLDGRTVVYSGGVRK